MHNDRHYRLNVQWVDVDTKSELDELPLGSFAYCREDGNIYLIGPEQVKKPGWKPTPVLVWIKDHAPA